MKEWLVRKKNTRKGCSVSIRNIIITVYKTAPMAVAKYSICIVGTKIVVPDPIWESRA